MGGWAGSVRGAAIVVGAQGGARPDGPAELDVRRRCRAAARGSVTVGGDQQACLNDERTAKDALAKDWSSFSPLALRPGERAEAAPILGKRILCGTLVVQAGLLVAPDRDRSAGGSAAAYADVKLRRPIGARCALGSHGNCGAYDADGESSHDVPVSIGVSTPMGAGSSIRA